MSWSKFLELVGPNNTTIGILAKDIICIIPLSIVIHFSSLLANAVTKAGQSKSDFSSGKIAPGT